MKEYELTIYDSEGEPIRKISKEYTPVKATQEDVEERFIVKVPLKSNPFLIKRGKLYTVEEDEEG